MERLRFVIMSVTVLVSSFNHLEIDVWYWIENWIDSNVVSRLYPAGPACLLDQNKLNRFECWSFIICTFSFSHIFEIYDVTCRHISYSISYYISVLSLTSHVGLSRQRHLLYKRQYNCGDTDLSQRHFLCKRQYNCGNTYLSQRHLLCKRRY